MKRQIFLYILHFTQVCMFAMCLSIEPAVSSSPDRLIIPTGSDAKMEKLDANIEKIAWEKDGTLTWEAPPGDRVLFSFPLPAGARFLDYGLGKFDLKIEGGPVDVMIFIEQPGKKRRVYRPIDIFIPPKGWQTVHFDLAQPEIVRESHFEADEPRITFNLWSVKGGYPDEEPTRKISIRNLRLTKRWMDVRWNGVDYISRINASGDLVYEYPIVVYNRDTKSRSITVRMEKTGRHFASASIKPEKTKIGAGDSITFTAAIRLPESRMDQLPPLYCEWFHPVFSVKGVQDSDEGILRSSDRIPLPIIIMPELENPIVVVDREKGLREMRERYKNTDWGKKEGDRYINQAENILKSDLTIPDGPGWASAYYFCEEHRCYLKYEGPDKHRCPQGGEYRDVDFMGVDLDRDRRTSEHIWATDRIKMLALAFTLTGDKRFSRAAVNMLNQYKEKYFTWDWLDLDASTETIDKGRMQFAKYMENYPFTNFIEAIDLLKGTGGISDKEARDIEKELILPGVAEITDYRMGVLCRQAGITTMALKAGLVCRHAPILAFAIASPFGYYSLRKVGGTSEGIGHGHGYAQSGWSTRQFIMADLLNRVGVNTFDNELKRLIDSVIWWDIPPNPGRYSEAFSIAAKHYPDPLYRQFARRTLMDGEPPALQDAKVDITIPPSVNYPFSGLTIFRRYFDDDMLQAEFRWSMPGNRGEFSLLSLGFFCYGYEFQRYPGHFPWGSTDLHHEWQIQSASHSTIVVDRRNHSGMRDYFKGHYMPHPSEQLFYEDGKNATSVIAYNDRIYHGVKIWRAVSVLDGAVLVMDIIRSDEEHIYDHWFHGVPDHSNGIEGIHLAMKPRSKPLGSEDGYEMVHTLSSGFTVKDYRADWTVPAEGDRKEFTLSMRVLNSEPLDVVHGFEWSRQYKKPEKEFLMMSRKARNADFIVLYEPHRNQSQLSVFERFEVTSPDGKPVKNAVGIRITLRKTSLEIILNPDGKEVRTVKGSTKRILSVEVR